MSKFAAWLIFLLFYIIAFIIFDFLWDLKIQGFETGWDRIPFAIYALVFAFLISFSGDK